MSITEEKPLTVQRAGIVVEGLSKTFGASGPPVMAGVDLEVACGELVAVVGASGCGKSTLLRLLAGFEIPTEGRVIVDDRQVEGPGPDRGVVFQDYGLFPWLTVRENVCYGPRQTRASRAAARETADHFIEAVGLTRVASKYPSELSGGMQQRVAIARVLANKPAVLLMDEPFGALDALTRTSLQRELSAIHQKTGTTTVFVTHSIEEAVFLADRVVVMSGGTSHGVPGHVKEIVGVTLPRERDVSSAEFNEVERRLTAMVHAGH